MMTHNSLTLDKIIQELNLTLLTDPKSFSDVVPSTGYTSDLLSCVMTGATHEGIWITLQCHANIVAVAALLELSAVIITEGAMPEPGTITKANQEEVVLLSTDKPSFYVAGRLWEMGMRSN